MAMNLPQEPGAFGLARAGVITEQRNDDDITATEPNAARLTVAPSWSENPTLCGGEP